MDVSCWGEKKLYTIFSLVFVFSASEIFLIFKEICKNVIYIGFKLS